MNKASSLFAKRCRFFSELSLTVLASRFVGMFREYSSFSEMTVRVSEYRRGFSNNDDTRLKYCSLEKVLRCLGFSTVFVGFLDIQIGESYM